MNKFRIEVLDKFKPLMVDDHEKIQKQRNYILVSGRVGGKTFGLTQKAFINLCQYKTHDIQILRANSSSMQESIFSELKKFFFQNLPDNIFAKFKFKSSPPLKITSAWGNQIHFSGVGLGSKSGSNISRGKSPDRPLSLIIVEETQEIFSGLTGSADLLNHALATYLRYLDDKIGKVIYAGNRDRNLNAKFNVWCREKEKDSSFITIETNWTMIRHWLNQATIQAIEMERELNPKNYEYMFMGIPVGGNDLVYGAFTESIHVVPKLEHNKEYMREFKIKYTEKIEKVEIIHRLFIGVDGANSRDTAAFIPIFNTKTNKLIVKTGEIFSHNPKKNGIIRNNVLVGKHIFKWFNEMLNKYHLHMLSQDEIIFVVDGHNIDLIEQLQFYLGNNATIIKFTQKDLIKTTERVNNAFVNRNLFIEEDSWVELFQNPEFPTPPSVLFNELQTVAWDETHPDKFNDSIPNDLTDGIRYPVAFYADPEHLYIG